MSRGGGGGRAKGGADPDLGSRGEVTGQGGGAEQNLVGRPSRGVSSEGIEACSRGGNLSIFSLKPTVSLRTALSLSCPAFARQPSLPAPLRNLGILGCSSVNSLSHWVFILLPRPSYLFSSGLILALTMISTPAYVRPNMLFNVSNSLTIWLLTSPYIVTVCSSICPSTYRLPTHYPPIHLPTCTFKHPLIRPSIHLPTHLYLHPSIEMLKSEPG